MSRAGDFNIVRIIINGCTSCENKVQYHDEHETLTMKKNGLAPEKASLSYVI